MTHVGHSRHKKVSGSNKKRLRQYTHINNRMKMRRVVAIVFFVAPLLSILTICLVGCGNKFFDPTQVGRFRPIPAVNVILDSLGVAEEAPSAWAEAEEPKPIDAMVFETDYVLGPGDIVRITIFELLQEETVFISDYIVTETGKISIPEVREVEAAGFTESQLEEEIRQILSPSILKDPSVTVTLISSQQRLFSILGDGVPGPGRYIIPRTEFRLADALAVAGGISQFNISNVYVSRSVTGREPMAEPVKPGIIEPERPMQLFEPELQMLETIAPSAKRQWPPPKQGLLMAAAEMITDKELAEAASPEGFGTIDNGRQEGASAKSEILELAAKLAGRETMEKSINEDEVGRVEWIFRDGRWIPVQIGRPKPKEPVIKVEPEKPDGPLEEKFPLGFEWDQIGAAGVQTRVIKIPTDRLYAGDPRYNIVIRPGDTIYVPFDIIGEFSIMGNVNGSGFINITGRPMTLKMAIAAAGGLGPLAWPKRCEVIRRIGKNKEEIVMVDLDKIARGEQPDFFIKPNDLVNVGTHPTARWRAVLRNAFRATYGFGFIYDRNFADRDFGTRRPIPDWF
jgi:polysaccharide export outer membrane protein